jgi:hypothetical protein
MQALYNAIKKHPKPLKLDLSSNHLGNASENAQLALIDCLEHTFLSSLDLSNNFNARNCEDISGFFFTFTQNSLQTLKLNNNHLGYLSPINSAIFITMLNPNIMSLEINGNYLNVQRDLLFCLAKNIRQFPYLIILEMKDNDLALFDEMPKKSDNQRYRDTIFEALATLIQGGTITTLNLSGNALAILGSSNIVNLIEHCKQKQIIGLDISMNDLGIPADLDEHFFADFLYTVNDYPGKIHTNINFSFEQNQQLKRQKLYSRRLYHYCH